MNMIQRVRYDTEDKLRYRGQITIQRTRYEGKVAVGIDSVLYINYSRIRLVLIYTRRWYRQCNIYYL